MNFRRIMALAVSSISVLPIDPHVFWSPGNECVDHNDVVVTQNSSYFKTGFTGTSLGLIIDVSSYQRNAIPSGGWAQWVVSVDGGAPLPVALDAPKEGTGTVTVPLATGLPAGHHNLQAWFDVRDETDTYTPKNAQTIKAIVADDGAALQGPADSYTPLPDRMMIMGDSITKGYKAVDPGGASSSNNYPLTTFAATLGQALHCEYGIVGQSGQGWAHNTNPWNEVFPVAFTNYFRDHPRVWPADLKYLVVAEATNDLSDDVTAAVQAWLPKARGIVGPDTWIILVAPFNGTHVSELQAAMTHYRASGSDLKVALVDASPILSTATKGTFYTVDGTHPQPMLHPLYGAILASLIEQATSGSASSVR